MLQPQLAWKQMTRYVSKSDLLVFRAMTSWTTLAVLLAAILFVMWN